MYERLGIPVKPCASAAERCGRGHRLDRHDHLATSRKWADLSPGAQSMPSAPTTRINANSTMKPSPARHHCRGFVEQSRQEAGDLIIAFHAMRLLDGVKKLSEIVAGKASGQNE